MVKSPKLQAAVSLPEHFKIHEVRSGRDLPGLVPSIGPLAAFVGDWHGNGFNTIFRPNGVATPTPLPVTPASDRDNVLELNLTSETLSFSTRLGSIPNRGSHQRDIFLNGVPYLQTVTDITNPSATVGIHLEPGMWLTIPSTTEPNEPRTVARMASIPHGTTINAEGMATTIAGAPLIPAVSITPLFTDDLGPSKVPSQTAASLDTSRIPQDLTPFMAAGTITQAMIDDPNLVLRNHIAGQTITSTTRLVVSTHPPAPLTGGGTDNVAFLLSNAEVTLFTATFYIETVEYGLKLPADYVPNVPLQIQPVVPPGRPAPVFEVTPPAGVPASHTLTVHSTQIQYTQTVMLRFTGRFWPHVSVATLVPSTPIIVPWA
jgi:hypothetical protein